jgi:hypothetical protein
LDHDWAENFQVFNRRALQSDHWHSVPCSLYICIARFLNWSIYYDSSSILQKGDQVTVSADSGLFWAQIEDAWTGNYGACDWYSVKDAHGKASYHARVNLHKRVWVRKAFVGFSDDRKHDSWATQHFLDRVILHMHQQSTTPFTALHLHSDNAAQHFKNSKSKNWLSFQLKNGIKFATWSYGCPGHGMLHNYFQI